MASTTSMIPSTNSQNTSHASGIQSQASSERDAGRRAEESRCNLIKALPNACHFMRAESFWLCCQWRCIRTAGESAALQTAVLRGIAAGRPFTSTERTSPEAEDLGNRRGSVVVVAGVDERKYGYFEPRLGPSATRRARGFKSTGAACP